jgi:[ribosomal protein S5]-alanine N-acetyltransferase
MACLDPTPVETTRLTLRPVEATDLPDLLVMNVDARVTRFLPYATWRSIDDAQAWFQRMQALHTVGASLQWVVQDKLSGRILGSCLLFRFDAGIARAELGYVLGHAAWGQGYMAEALRGLIGACFARMDLRRLEAEVNPANLASVQLLQCLGFTHEGLLRQRRVGHDGPYDVAIFGLLGHELARPGATT